MFTALFIIVKKWKQPKCLSTNDQTRKMGSIHTMEHYSVIKRNEILIDATTLRHFENIMVSAKARLENTYVRIH